MVLQFVPGWRRDIMMYVYGQFHMAGRGGQCGNTSGRRCRNSVTPCNPALIRDRYTSHLHYISTLSTVCSAQNRDTALYNSIFDIFFLTDHLKAKCHDLRFC